MDEVVKRDEINNLVKMILTDIHGDKNIDRVSNYSKFNRSKVRKMINQLFYIIFPGYYRARNDKLYNFDDSLTVNIEDTFYQLDRLVTQALCAELCRKNIRKSEIKLKSYYITKAFFATIPAIRNLVEKDLLAIYQGDPAAQSIEEVIMSYPGIIAITTFRLAHELYLLEVPILPRLMTEYAHEQTGIDIHPGATIGDYFFIDHGTGIVIGETTYIGNHVKVYQGVTIGALSTTGGQSLAGIKRHPTIGNHVTIYAGASILGGDTVIGDYSVIGSNAFITASVPAGHRITNKNIC